MWACIMVVSANTILYAQEDDPRRAISEKVDEMAKRLDQIEENQKQILENQEALSEAIKNLRVWIRRN